MGKDLVVRDNATVLSIASIRSQDTGVRTERSLGTAAWLEFPEDQPLFPHGGFYISKLPAGADVGIRDDRHVLITCGTRGGKDASIVIPNLIRWPGSVVVVDPKGENAMVTARRRGRGSQYTHGAGQTVHILDPFGVVQRPDDDFSDVKACFNPLDTLSPDREKSVDDAVRIIDAIFIPEGAEQNYWNEAAQNYLKPLLLHVVNSPYIRPAERNLGTLRRLLVAGDVEMRRLMELNASGDDLQKLPSAMELLFAAFRRNPAFGGIIAEAGERYAALLRNSPRTLASAIEVACTQTDFLDSPAMRRSLARSDFSLSELKSDPRGVSLYLSLPQSDMGAHARWLRMMTTLIVTEFQRSHAQPASGHPVLMVLNEFAGLRRLKSIEEGVAQIAGYGAKMVFVTQTLAQLKAVYKDSWETFIANCGIKLFFCNDDHFTRDYVSKLIGEHEVRRRTYNGSATRGESRSKSKSATEGSSFTHGSGHSSSSSFNGQGTSSGSTSNSSTSTTSSFSTTQGQTRGTSESRTEGWNESVHKRPLLAPDEVGRRFGDRNRPRALALISGLQPLALERVPYFEDHGLAGFYDPHTAFPYPLTLAELAHQRETAEARRRAEEQHQAEMERLRALAEEERRIAQRRLYEQERLREEARMRRELELENRRTRVVEARNTSMVAGALGLLALTLPAPGGSGGPLYLSALCWLACLWMAVIAFRERRQLNACICATTGPE